MSIYLTRSVDLQLCSFNLHNFLRLWWLSKFCNHHKWNEAWLLVRNWYIWVASLVTEQFPKDLRKLENIREMPNVIELLRSVQSSSQNKNVSTSKIFWKTEIELFPKCALARENNCLSQMFFEWLKGKQPS